MAGPYSYGIAIEGVGLDTTKTAGTIWHFGDQLSAAAQTASTFDWEGGTNSNAGLVQQTSMKISTSVDPFTGDLRDSAFSFELHYSDTAAQNLIYLQVETVLSMSGGASVGANLSDSGTTITIDGTGDTGLANTVVWIADEAILLGTHNGSGEYAVSGGTSGRGIYGTTATMHRINEKVYTANNTLAGRRVRLYQFDHSDSSLVVKWTGFVNDHIGTVGDGLKIRIPCQGLLSVLKGAVINRGAPLKADAMAWMFAGNSLQPSGYIDHHSKGEQKRVAKAGDTAHKQAYQLDEAIIFGDYSDTKVSSTKATEFLRNSSTAHLWDVAPGFDPDAAGEDSLSTVGYQRTIYEVFVVARKIDEEQALASANMFSATRDLTFPFHPAEIAMALLTSTRDTAVSTSTILWDCLNYPWSVGAPLAWFDASGISTAIDETQHRKIDQLTLGYDGKPVNAWEVCKSVLLAPHGLFFGSTSAGLVNIGRFKGAADIKDSINATAITAIPEVLEWAPSRADSVDVITGTVGATPLGYEGVPITVNARDYATDEANDSLRAALFTQRKEFEIDYQTINAHNAKELVDGLISKIITLHLASPRIKIRVANADTYDIGAYFSFTVDVTKHPENNGWFVDNTGAMTSTTTGASFIGMLVGRTFDVRAQTYDLTLLLTNYRLGKYPRHRPPSAEVASYDQPSSTITTVSSAFASGDDARTFAATQFVEVWKPNYTLRSGTVGSPDAIEIASVANDSIVLNSAFATDPVAGDIIELAHLTTATGSPEDGTTQPYLGGTVNTHTFLGASGTVGNEAVAAHIYSDE